MPQHWRVHPDTGDLLNVWSDLKDDSNTWMRVVATVIQDGTCCWAIAVNPLYSDSWLQMNTWYTAHQLEFDNYPWILREETAQIVAFSIVERKRRGGLPGGNLSSAFCSADRTHCRPDCTHVPVWKFSIPGICPHILQFHQLMLECAWPSSGYRSSGFAAVIRGRFARR